MGEIWLVVILYWFINVTFAPTALYAGRLSDRTGRKLPIFLSLVILAALTLGFAFVGPTYWHIGVLFALHGIYQGFLKPAQKAFVADLAPEELRATALGGYSMLTGAASVPGPLIFGLLWDYSGGPRLPFILSGSFVALSAILLLLFVREPKRKSAQ
jgi:MFS family permease